MYLERIYHQVKAIHLHTQRQSYASQHSIQKTDLRLTVIKTYWGLIVTKKKEASKFLRIALHTKVRDKSIKQKSPATHWNFHLLIDQGE